jgi:nucleoside-diphosphate-sugar epimerase
MRDLKGLPVAIIGGAGFIGHHLALGLAAAGTQPHAIDSLQVNNLLSFANRQWDRQHYDLDQRILNERIDLLRAAGIPLHMKDARSYHELSQTLADIQPRAIFHLAAVAHANRSNVDPLGAFDHNLHTLANSLEYARQGGVERFLYLSSSLAYGNFRTPAVTEEHPLEPVGIYGALKLSGEKMVIAQQQVFGLPYTIIRPSALYGPRCVSRRVIQMFLENAFEGRPLTITGDGSERLDFTYVDDLVQGLIGALNSPGAVNEIFNLTAGHSRSIADVVGILRKSFPNLMPVRGTLDVSKAQRVFGYQVTHTLEVGLPKYLEWYRQLYADLPG